MSNTIVTIGRMFGSGGSEIGKIVADKLGYNYYDKELIKRAVIESGISEEVLAEADEKPVNSFLYSIVTHGFPAYSAPVQYNNLSMNDKVYSIQAGIIKNIAESESAVVIGRCADDILRENPNAVKVFIYSERSERVKRIASINGLSEKEALEIVKKTDKSRSNYYEFFTNKRWGDPLNYDICINSSLGIEKCAEVIINYIKIVFDSPRLHH